MWTLIFLVLVLSFYRSCKFSIGQHPHPHMMCSTCFSLYFYQFAVFFLGNTVILLQLCREIVTMLMRHLRNGLKLVTAKLWKSEEKRGQKWPKCKDTHCLLQAQSRRNLKTDCPVWICLVCLAHTILLKASISSPHALVCYCLFRNMHNVIIYFYSGSCISHCYFILLNYKLNIAF